MIKFYVSCIILALVSASCGKSSPDFDANRHLRSKPNVTLALYIQKHPNFCRTSFSKNQVWMSVGDIKDKNNRKAEYLLRLGFCHAMNNNKDMSALYMYRVVALNDLIETDGTAHATALSFLHEGASATNVVDFGWSNKRMLENGIPASSPLSDYAPETRKGRVLLEGTQSRNKMNLRVFESEFDSSRGEKRY